MCSVVFGNFSCHFDFDDSLYITLSCVVQPNSDELLLCYAFIISSAIVKMSAIISTVFLQPKMEGPATPTTVLRRVPPAAATQAAKSKIGRWLNTKTSSAALQREEVVVSSGITRMNALYNAGIPRSTRKRKEKGGSRVVAVTQTGRP